MPTPSDCPGGDRAMRAGALRACRGRSLRRLRDRPRRTRRHIAAPAATPTRGLRAQIRTTRTTPLTVLAPFFLSVNRTASEPVFGDRGSVSFSFRDFVVTE